MSLQQSGQLTIGTRRPVTSTEEIHLGALYVVEGYFHPVSALSDAVIARGIALLVGLDSPIDITFVSVDDDGFVSIQGRASHNSPVLIISAAVILILAGIGITLAVQNIYVIVDGTLALGTLPGGSPALFGDGGILTYVVPIFLVVVAVYLWLRFKT